MKTAMETIKPTHAQTKSWLESMTAPVATISPVLHPELAIMQRRLLDLFFEHEAYLKTKPRQFIEELLHRSDEQRNATDFSVRVSAEFNRTACVRILEGSAR